MRRTLTFLFITFFSLIGAQSFGQKKDKASAQSAFLISPEFGLQFTGGDLSERFENNFSVGLGFGYKTASNWTFSASANYIFSNNVKNISSILSPILTESGNIINQTGNYAQFSVNQRGIMGVIEVGKTLKFLQANPNSGTTISAGGGVIYHWIHFDNIGNDSPQILDDYTHGYDRLTAGPILKQSVGYTYLSNNHRINFKLSFEIIEGFTTNLRGFNYDTGKTDNTQRLDLLYGFRLNWYLPLYGGNSTETFYYK